MGSLLLREWPGSFVGAQADLVVSNALVAAFSGPSVLLFVVASMCASLLQSITVRAKYKQALTAVFHSQPIARNDDFCVLA